MADQAPTQVPPPSWLHTLLTHHVAVLALGGALGGAVGPAWTELKAWRLGVASSTLQIAEEQRRLWERNLECLTAQGIYEVDGPDGIVVKVTLCPKTADLLIRYHLGEWTPIYRWVQRPRLTKE